MPPTPRLDRTVSVKVLPAHLSENEDLNHRFEREAKAISSLNHPQLSADEAMGRRLSPLAPKQVRRRLCGATPEKPLVAAMAK
jgi:hypothetical protein